MEEEEEEEWPLYLSRRGLRAYFQSTLDLLTSTVFDDRRHILNTLLLHELISRDGFTHLYRTLHVLFLLALPDQGQGQGQAKRQGEEWRRIR